MHKVIRIIKKNDGSEVRICAENFFGLGLTRSVGVYVHQRGDGNSEWKLCNDRPHKDWWNMSVDDYVKYGRSEMLMAASIGEILKTISLLTN